MSSSIASCRVLPLVAGSLGTRVNELKQKLIAENPRHYGLAVPRKSFNTLFLSFLDALTQLLALSVAPSQDFT